jgi:GNAT superfamily N-acetyltransferase
MTLTPNSGGTLREANPCHEPAGSPAGGQFCSGKGGPGAAIQRGEAYKVTEDQFLDYHRTGSIPSSSYERYESGDFDHVHRSRFTTLISRVTINGEQVEIRLEAEPARYGKRKEAASEAERDRLYAEYEAAARALGTNPMSAGIDLGRDSAQYKALDVYAKRWLDSGEDWVRDANGDVVYYSPEEAKAKGLAPFTYTVGAFVGDRAVGYAGDEFGASGVYVARAYQRHGLGLTLLKTYLEKSGRLAAGQKLGQMTAAGQQLVRRLHRQLVKEQLR